MLQPHDRLNLFDSLCPPDGYELDYCLWTTYSLDLVTLLTVPLAFTFRNWEDSDGRPFRDEFALLEALRQHANRMKVFCQVGNIKIPPPQRPLFEGLEGAVIQVRAPKERGVFHPKIGILRFVSPDEPVIYRFLCLSRNLTFDRSWDTALVLEGELRDRQNAIRANLPLAGFVEKLPSLATPPVAEETAEKIEEIADELRRVSFQPPDGFEVVAFLPLGVDHEDITQWDRFPFEEERVDRMLVVSPFVRSGLLRDIHALAEDNILVTRLDEARKVSAECLDQFDKVYTMHPWAQREEDLPEDDEDEEEQDQEEGREDRIRLEGLHAKLYVADAGWDANLWTGSANATEAAFARNVEFLVQLQGKKSECGIDAILESRGEECFRSLLQELPEEATGPEAPAEDSLKKLAEDAGHAIATSGLKVKLIPAEGDDLYDLQLMLEDGYLMLPAGVRAFGWPITVREASKVAITRPTGLIAELKDISLVQITSFIAFELVAGDAGKESSHRFVLNLPLEGAPTDRRERLLRALIKNEDEVLRYLFFLLSDRASTGDDEPPGGGIPPEAGDKRWVFGFRSSLFEALTRALYRSPEKLDHVKQVSDDLTGTPEGRGLLPDGFEAIWPPIWAAREKLGP